MMARRDATDRTGAVIEGAMDEQGSTVSRHVCPDEAGNVAERYWLHIIAGNNKQAFICGN
jgi:hypothetical protein